jgi:ketol-acid reductoisomerase
MTSLASRSATQALRAASRRAPRALANAVRPSQAASYSLFAKAAVARCSQESTVLVRLYP